MLFSRGAMLISEGWTKIARTAIEVGYMPMIKAILENHSMINSSRAFGEEALEYAASLEDESIFDSTLDLRSLPTDRQLHRAARRGHCSTVKLLLNGGAAIDEKYDNGHTPLREAAVTEQTSVVKLLLLRGAKVDAKDMDRQAIPSANQSETP